MRFLCLLLSMLLASPVVPGQQMRAEEHVVSSVELQHSLHAAAERREQDLGRFDHLLSNQAVRGALQSARLDTAKVHEAAAMLSDDELARLADRAGRVERDMAAGALSNQELTYIVIALATAVIILVIVKAS